MTEEEKIPLEELLGTVQLIKSACQMAMLVPLDHAVAALRQAQIEETTAVFLDPTHWMKHHDAMNDNVKLLAIFAEFRGKLAKLAGED